MNLLELNATDLDCLAIMNTKRSLYLIWKEYPGFIRESEWRELETILDNWIFRFESRDEVA